MRLRPAFAGLLLVLGGGCNQIFGLDPPGGDDSGGDASNPDGALGKFDEPVPIEAAALPGVAEDDPALTPSGEELYYSRVLAADEDIVVAPWNGSTWSNPQTSPLSAAVFEDGGIHFIVPSGDPTGVQAYFVSTRPAGSSLDIYTSQHGLGQEWSEPMLAGPLSTFAEDSAASPCGDGMQFIIASTRGGASSDLFEVDPFDGERPVMEANTPAQETGPYITRDCLRLYYASDSRGTFDLYVITRPGVGQSWGPPQLIEELSDPTQHEGDPWLSEDERHILFASTGNNGTDFDIMEAHR